MRPLAVEDHAKLAAALAASLARPDTRWNNSAWQLRRSA
jgi:hypothetical protein